MSSRGYGFSVDIGRLRRAARLLATDPVAVDVVLCWSVIVIAVVLNREYRPSEWPPLDAAGYALSCLIGVPVLFRRRAPMVVLCATCFFWVWYIVAGYYSGGNDFAPEVAWYTVASMRRPRQALPGAVLLVGVWLYSGLASRQYVGWSSLTEALLVTALLWKFGNNARHLAVVAEELRQEQEARARRAVADERLRIARELHDVVAHHMSVMSMQLGVAGYVLTSDPDTARESLRTAADTSREALDEMRRLLVLLRPVVEGADDAVASGEPAPGLDRIERLAERVRAAGVPVALSVTGSVRTLPPGLEQCAYRIVQESLTNVIKHARPSSATVDLRYGTRALAVHITDDGCGGRSRPAVRGTGGGQGMLGMRERAALYGGTLTAGPRPDGGFEVTLVLPIPAPAAAKEPA